MKIAFLSLYTGYVSRGVETWVNDISQRLADLGNEVFVYSGADDGLITNYHKQVLHIKANIRLRKGESLIEQSLTWPYWEILNFIFTFRCIYFLILNRPDIVMPSNGGSQTLIVRIAGFLFGWKTVVVAHAGLGAHEKWNLLTRSDLYIYPSRRAMGWANNLFFSKGLKLINIPHGIDLHKFKKEKSDLKLKLQKPVYLIVASFDPYKRVYLAVKAVSKLKKGSLLVVGGDRENGEIDILATKLLGEGRYFKTKVKLNEISRYYNFSDVFTLPSNIFEAFGIVYLEAMACGLSVVATDDELRREVVGEAGILVDPENIDEYSKALEKAATKNWGEVPRKQAEKFSWDIIAKKYEAVFQGILKK